MRGYGRKWKKALNTNYRKTCGDEGKGKNFKKFNFFFFCSLHSPAFYIWRFFIFYFFIFIIHQAVFLKRGEINEMKESIILWRDFLRWLYRWGKKNYNFSFDLNRLWIQIIRLLLGYMWRYFLSTMWIENEGVYIDDGMNYVFWGACLMVHRIFPIFLP